MATASEIQKYYSQYLGFSPDSKSLSGMAMMSPAEVEDTLKNTRTEVQSSATQTAQSAISSLMSPGGEMLPPAVGDYLTQMAQGREMLADRYGLTEAEKRMREAEQFYQSIAQKGPMLGQTMAGGLMEMSPTFLGATRKDLEGKFADIENPFVRDSMIDSYLRAADKSMVATLNALNGLYQTSLMSAQTAMESEQRNYLGIADKVKDLYSELQWMNRNRVQEQMKEKNEQVPDWFRQDIINEYAAKGQTPLEHVIEGRWQQERMAKEKEKWFGKGITNEPLDALNLKRWKDLYPDAGITAGDTEKDAELKTRLWEYIRNLPETIKQSKKDGKTKEQFILDWEAENPGDEMPTEIKDIIDKEFKTTGEKVSDWWETTTSWLKFWE